MCDTRPVERVRVTRAFYEVDEQSECGKPCK